MSSSLKIVLSLLAAGARVDAASADTKRMQQVATLLGIDEKSQSAQAKEAESAVDRLVALGLKSYPTLQSREAELQARRAYVEAAQGSYQPKLQVQAEAAEEQSKDLLNSNVTRRDRQGASLVLRENIWRGGQDSGQIDLAKQDEEIAAIQQLNELEFVTFSIRKAALDYNYRSLRQVIEEASLADAAELKNLAERKFRAGQVGSIDIHLSSMRESAARAESARVTIQSQQAYQVLLGSLGPQVELEDLEQDIKTLGSRALPLSQETPVLTPSKNATFAEKNSLALQKRAEITLDQGYRGRFLPSIDFVGTHGRTNASSWLEDRDDNKARVKALDTTLALQLTWTLWDRTQDYSNRAAAFLKTSAMAEVDTARHLGQTQSQQLQTYIVDVHKTLAFAKAAYEQAGDLYDAQRKLYESGVIGIQPLVDAEREKRNAISAWHDSVYELQLSILRWNALQKGYLSNSEIRRD